VLLVGDSHAQQWLPAMEVLARDRGWRLRAVTKSACPLVDATVWNGVLRRGYRECDAWREGIRAFIAAERPALVVVANDHRYELVDGEGSRLEAGHEAWTAALAAELTAVGEHAPVVVIADTPRLGYDPAECLATSEGIEACDVERSRMEDTAYAEQERVAAADAGAGLVSATDWICEADDCPLVRGSILVYRDSHHLTATYAARLAERLGVALDTVTGDVVS
jgi:hypothetical protein